MKYLGAFLLIVGLLGLGGGFVLQSQGEVLQASVFDLVDSAQEAGVDAKKWREVSAMAKDEIPWFPGLIKIRNAFGEVANILDEADLIQREFFAEELGNEIPLEKIWRTFDSLNRIDESAENIEEAIDVVPDWLIPEAMEVQRNDGLEQLRFAREKLGMLIDLEDVIKRWADDGERLVVILQNPNEPRSTGGFMGSLLVIDFGEEVVSWKFQDIYAIDRLIPQDMLVPTPDWFRGLSDNLSLRDANFWPDFPSSAGEIRNFFVLAGERSPGTVVAITPEWVKVWLELIGGTRLPKWDIGFTPDNFDLVLQFLVESKIAGRWGVKDPVMDLAEQMFAPYALQRITFDKVKAIDWERLLAEKHVQAHSLDDDLQVVFDDLNISGRVVREEDADNFIYFDFVSIGANKSEKFMWSKFDHNSEIAADGTVINTLKFKRSHSLRAGEISRLLGDHLWSQNVRELLSDDIFWKLGYGENRTMLRVWVPADALLLEGYSPSGSVREVRRAEGDFVMLEIPMNVLPGESVSGGVKYQTRLSRGSLNWRPYNLQIVGTPARKQSEFMSSISTKGGRFTAESLNIGKPLGLVDDNVRAVVEFDSTLPVAR